MKLMCINGKKCKCKCNDKCYYFLLKIPELKIKE